MKLLYHDAECGPSVDHLILQHNVVEIRFPKEIIGWTVTDKQLMRVNDWLQFCT